MDSGNIATNGSACMVSERVERMFGNAKLPSR